MSSSSTIADRASLGWIVAFACAAWLATHAAFALAPDLFRAWDRRTSDQFFVLRSGIDCRTYPCRDGVVHVDVTYSGLRQMANRQLTRADHARVIDSLGAAGATAHVFDMVFAVPGEPADNAALVQAAAASGRAYFAVAFHLQPDAATTDGGIEDEPHVEAAAWDVTIDGDARDLPEGFRPLATYADLSAVSRLGFINLSADGDGIFRRTPLLMRYKGRVFPSLGLRVACDALGVAPRDVVVTPRREIRLRHARRPGSADARDIVIPIDGGGDYRIDFAGPWEAFRHVSYREVWRAARDPLALEEVKEALGGRIAVVADTSTGSGDGGPVPTDPRFLLPGIHATVIQNILQESFVREARTAERVAIELVLFAAVTLCAWRLGSRGIAAAAVLLGAAYAGMALGTFLYLRVILPVIGPSLLLASAAFVTIVYRFINEEKARAVLRQSFAAYFPPAVVDRIVRNPGLVTESGQKKELSILFSDIVGFTSLCETMTPEETRAFLNRHFAAMVDIAFEYGGTVDKFIGDGLMVFFGDPDDQPDHAVRAARSAIAMQRKVRELGGYELRIGINTGSVTVGNMGSPRRLSYTVLGAPVNLAQRLESNAPPGGILVADRTRELIAGAIPTIPRGAIPIKGMARDVPVHEVPVDARV